MIRCGECEYLGLWPERISVRWPKKHKTFFGCSVHRTDNGTCVMWDKVPKRHPNWCPKYLEVKRDG